MATLSSYVDLTAAKDGAFTPVLLCDFTFADGTELHVATQDLLSEDNRSYNGTDYMGRVAQQDISALQARSRQGVDTISDCTIHLYNADQFIYDTYENDPAKGFKGARLNLNLVLMDIDPSTGSYVFNPGGSVLKFDGTCDAPSNDQGMLTVRATTSHNLSALKLPSVHCQGRCIQQFPGVEISVNDPDTVKTFKIQQAKELRLKAASDLSSWSYGCGYCPDQAATDPETGGSAQVGNQSTANLIENNLVITDSDGNFLTCNYTKTDCVARGMYTTDSAGRQTGRYMGEQWSPPNRVGRSPAYITRETVTVMSQRIEGIYGKPYPMVYGTQWIENPLVVNILGDGNSTRMEVVVTLGDVGSDGIIWVVVNGTYVPQLGTLVHSIGGELRSVRLASPLITYYQDIFRWNFSGKLQSHTGGRTGAPTDDAGYDDSNKVPQGDPHGSLCCIEVVVPHQLSESQSAPQIRVYLTGPKIKHPPLAGDFDHDSQNSWPYEHTNNAAFVLLDLLIWTNYAYSDLDLPSFVAAANHCAENIFYTAPDGTKKSHPRFVAELALDSFRPASEVISGVLRAFNAQLVTNDQSTGKVRLLIRGSLGMQQPTPIDGSNYSSPLDSVDADNNAVSGYIAYLIDETVIQQNADGTPKIRGPYCLPSAQTPNRISFAFQNEENSHSNDTITVSDAGDIAKTSGPGISGNIVDAGYPVIGPNNFDQGIRICNLQLAEGLRGNEIGDTRGTRFLEVETTHRLEHLRAGDIILFRSEYLKLSSQFPPTINGNAVFSDLIGIYCRVESIVPTTDFRRMTLTLRWHEDYWYTDAYGQHAAPPNSSLRKDEIGTVFNWQPFGERPITGDVLFSDTNWNFKVSQFYTKARDGSIVAKVAIAGCPPANKMNALKPPVFSTPFAKANPTGGSILDGFDYIVRVAAVSAQATAEMELDFSGVPNDGDTITIDGITYTFVNTLNNGVPYQVQIGSVGLSARNLSEALVLGGTPGVDYSSATTAHPTVESFRLTGTNNIVFSAITGGKSGNDIAVTNGITNTSSPNSSGTSLTGGSDEGISALSEKCVVRIPFNGIDTNTITTSDITWDANTVGYLLFAGTNQSLLPFQYSTIDTGGQSGSIAPVAFVPGTPTTITITDLAQRTFGPPDAAFDHFRLRIKQEFHPGVWTAQGTILNGHSIQFEGANFDPDQWTDYTLSFLGFADPENTAAVPIIDLKVTGNDTDTLTVTVNNLGDYIQQTPAEITLTFAGAPNDGDTISVDGVTYTYVTSIDDQNIPNQILLTGTANAAARFLSDAINDAQPGVGSEYSSSTVAHPSVNSTTTVGVSQINITALAQGTQGDGIPVVINAVNVIPSLEAQNDGSFALGGGFAMGAHDIWTLRTKPNLFSASQIGDPGFVNCFNPGGLITGAEAGRVLRIIAGTGAGAIRNIINNDETTITVDPPFELVPDDTSRFIIEDAHWLSEDTSGTFLNGKVLPEVQQIGFIDIANIARQPVLVEVLTEDKNNKASLDAFGPYRDMWVWGSGGLPIATFAVGTNGPSSAGENISTPITVYGQSRTLTQISARTNVAPDGDVSFDVLRSRDQGATWQSFFKTGVTITIPAGDTTEHIETQLAITDIRIGDWLRLDQTGADIEMASVELHGF